MLVQCDLCGKKFESDGRRVYHYCSCGSEIKVREPLTKKCSRSL